MFKWGKYLLVLCVFISGVLAGYSYDYLSYYSKEQPFSISGIELASPSDWISEKQIKTYEGKLLLDIENFTIARFTDTNSMDPVIDETANSIEIMPEKDSLNIGDIISYSLNRKKIIHRIVYIGEDESGIFYLTKGDNNQNIDSEKVRFEQITGVVVGILY